MKELLKEVLQHCLDMQRLAETKNAGLIAFNSAVGLASVKFLTEDSTHIYLKFYLAFVLLCVVVSVFLNLSAISAQLKHKEQEIQNFRNKNLLFFGTISNYSSDDYLAKLKAEYGIDEDITRYHQDLSRQVVVNAQIALRKFKLFNTAFKWTITGVATPISLIIFIFFFDNNR